MIVFVVLKTLGSYYSVIRLNLVTEKIVSELKSKCYQNINNLDYYFYEHETRGELMTNFTSDMQTIRKQFDFNIKTLGAIVLTFICSLGYLFTINMPFTLILLTPGVLVGVISYRFIRKVKPEYEKLRNIMSCSNDFVSDNIEANRVVKTFEIGRAHV